eukprot:TRINITY_DN10214_c0_g1_i1.p1 TRINITY_DN10214_c0_g1~~TRINITY_DN10214_c0_g1_i1.p1  ORF type:complete len:793 (-),score=97.60 TRINITY_DN10214_c0_g1_i1:141-2474(-)
MTISTPLLTMLLFAALSAAQDCAYIRTCSACNSAPGCGWCVHSATCVNESALFIGTAASDCTQCSLAISVPSCNALGCAWSNGSCIQQSLAISQIGDFNTSADCASCSIGSPVCQQCGEHTYTCVLSVAMEQGCINSALSGCVSQVVGSDQGACLSLGPPCQFFDAAERCGYSLQVFSPCTTFNDSASCMNAGCSWLSSGRCLAFSDVQQYSQSKLAVAGATNLTCPQCVVQYAAQMSDSFWCATSQTCLQLTPQNLQQCAWPMIGNCNGGPDAFSSCRVMLAALQTSLVGPYTGWCFDSNQPLLGNFSGPFDTDCQLWIPPGLACDARRVPSLLLILALSAGAVVVLIVLVVVRICTMRKVAYSTEEPLLELSATLKDAPPPMPLQDHCPAVCNSTLGMALRNNSVYISFLAKRFLTIGTFTANMSGVFANSSVQLPFVFGAMSVIVTILSVLPGIWSILLLKGVLKTTWRYLDATFAILVWWTVVTELGSFVAFLVLNINYIAALPSVQAGQLYTIVGAAAYATSSRLDYAQILNLCLSVTTSLSSQLFVWQQVRMLRLIHARKIGDSLSVADVVKNSSPLGTTGRSVSLWLKRSVNFAVQGLSAIQAIGGFNLLSTLLLGPSLVMQLIIIVMLRSVRSARSVLFVRVSSAVAIFLQFESLLVVICDLGLNPNTASLALFLATLADLASLPFMLVMLSKLTIAKDPGPPATRIAKFFLYSSVVILAYSGIGLFVLSFDATYRWQNLIEVVLVFGGMPFGVLLSLVAAWCLLRTAT